MDPDKLRHIALTRQGLVHDQPFGRGLKATLRAIQHLGYIQIDTISVVVRAHNHVLRTRVPNFETRHIDRLLKDRKIFEYRFPVASFRPMEEFRFALPHMRSRRAKEHSKDHRLMMKRVLQRIRDEGPLKSRDFEDQSGSSRQGWWDWKPAKRALEQLYYQGDLMISARNGFEKSYDLTERVLPDSIDTSEPTDDEFASHLIDNTLRAHGFANAKSFTLRGRGTSVGHAVKAELRRRLAAGELMELTDNGGNKWLTEPQTLDERVPRTRNHAHILSPFDNAVIERERILKLFGFDYQIECYVPEQNRRYGYFCLPILYHHRLVGRMDCKSHRESGCFELKSLFLEPDFSSRPRVNELIDPLATAIVDFARFDGCNEAAVTHSEPGFTKQLLTKALSRRLSLYDKR